WHHNTVLALVSCCKCLEIALEYSTGCFGILFRDLNGLDKLLDVVAALSKDCYDCWTSSRESTDGVAGGDDYEKMLVLSNRRNELQAVLNLLKTSVHNIDPSVGMNLNEALGGREIEESEGQQLSEDSARRRREGFQKVMVRLFGDGGEAIGAQNIGYLAQLLHYICDNDPIIIPTVLGPNGELLKAMAKSLPVVRNSSFALGWTSTALSSFSLHNKGAELLRDLQGEDNPLTKLVRLVMTGDGAGVRPVSPLAEKVTSDLPMMLSQSLEDIVRNRNELAKPLVEAAVGGLEDLLAWADREEAANNTGGLLSAKLAPACRLLTSLLQTHSSMAKLFVMEDTEGGGKSSKPGQHLNELLVKLATHPSLPKGSSILAPVVMIGSATATSQQQGQQQHPHYHPIVATFRALENAFYNNLSPPHASTASSSSASSQQTDSADCVLPLASLVVDNGQKLAEGAADHSLLSAVTFGLKVLGLVHAPFKDTGGGLFGSSTSPAGASTRDYLSYSLLPVLDTVCKFAPELLEQLAVAEVEEADRQAGPTEVNMDLTLQLNSPPNQVRRSRFMRDTIDWRKAVEMSAEKNDSVDAMRWSLWSAVKKFMEAVTKLANTPSGRIKRVNDMFFSSLSHKQISNSARIASVLLSSAFIAMTKRYASLQEKVDATRLSTSKKRFATELFELLAKCHVEDRSHHIRVLSIDAMFKMGGFGQDFTNMVVDVLKDPLTDETLSASVLGYCERITSVKRMENSNLTQPALFPTIDKSTPSAVQSFLKVDGYRLVSSLQVRLPAALLPLWRDDAWLGREAASEEEKAGEAKRYVMSARACGSMVKLFTHAVEPDPRVVDDDTATSTTSPPPDGSEGSPAEAAIAEMLRAPALRRVPGDVAMAEENPPAAASAEASPKASTAPSATDATPVGDPSISLKSSSAAHYALKENFIAVLRDRVPALRKVDSGLDLPSDLTAAEVRKNAEDVGRDFISRCISLSKKGGQPTHCADVISRVAQNCNRVRLGVAEGQPSEAGDETVRLKTHVANLLHVVGVVTGEFVDEIKVAAEGEDSAPNALQCLSHVLAFLTNASERVRASLWKSGKAQVIIEGYCHYCEKKVNAGDDDKMADAHSWLETMVEESAMLARTEGEEEASAKEMPAWLTEASLAIEGLCDEPYIYTGDWDALQQRLLAAVVGILTVHEERRSPSDPLRLVAVMVPSPDLTRAALEVMSLLANRE
ncbi:hypothetical protein FOZ62_025887, partial [Perkinsus olseni]